jgi:nucleoside-diphosphate-sugar epimerase
MKTLKTLLIGCNGYVGAAVAARLDADGHAIHGLARSEESAEAISKLGYEPVSGTIDDLEALVRIALQFDCLVFTPNIQPILDELPPVRALLNAYAGSGRTFIYTSGTNLFAIQSRTGEWSDLSFSEYDDINPPPWGTAKAAVEKLVLEAADRGVRAMVIRPPLIWGNGGSFQVPVTFQSVQATGAACYIGKGLHTYSNAHVDDVAEVFRLAMSQGRSGAIYHAVAGEANFRSIAQAVAKVMGCEARSVTYEEAMSIWNPWYVQFGLSSNSRTRAERTRSELGWEPRHLDLLEDIENGSYRKAFGKE